MVDVSNFGLFRKSHTQTSFFTALRLDTYEQNPKYEYRTAFAKAMADKNSPQDTLRWKQIRMTKSRMSKTIKEKIGFVESRQEIYNSLWFLRKEIFMTIEEVKEFIKQVPWGMLATTDGRGVGVRPMSGLAWNGNQLWCATFAATDKVKHLRKVPYAEYCFCDASGKHLRIAGACTVSSDNAEKLWLHKALPALKDYFPDPAAPEYVVIKMTPDHVRVTGADFTYERVEVK
jgi:general stress protein 26